MVFYYLILVLGGFRSLYFNRNKVTSYLKSLEYYYKNYRVKNNTEKKERTAEYSRASEKWDIEMLPEFKDSTSWEDFKKIGRAHV